MYKIKYRYITPKIRNRILGYYWKGKKLLCDVCGESEATWIIVDKLLKSHYRCSKHISIYYSDRP